MNIYVCKKGERVDPYPLPKGGWGKNDDPENGLVFSLNAEEKGAAGFFISEEKLAEVGYSNLNHITDYYMKLFKKDLQMVARRLGLSERGTKRQIVERILGIK